MLRREDECRRDPETQSLMEQAEESVDTEWMDVAAEVQRRVVKEFHELFSPAITVEELRMAAQRHPEIAHWVRYNRARHGKLKVGHVAPDVRIRHAYSGEVTTLLTSHYHSTNRESKGEKPIVVVAGSWS